MFHDCRYRTVFWTLWERRGWEDLGEWHVGSYLPNQGSNPHPLHWKVES